MPNAKINEVNVYNEQTIMPANKNDMYLQVISLTKCLNPWHKTRLHNTQRHVRNST